MLGFDSKKETVNYTSIELNEDINDETPITMIIEEDEKNFKFYTIDDVQD